MAPVPAPRVASPLMIGREPELNALAEMLHAPRSSAAAVALVGGRAGMGKTRLVTEASRRWRKEGVRVLIGYCAPVEGTPYAPLVASLRAVLPSNAPLLGMLSSSRAASRSELFDAMGSALAGLSARAPLILVIEDLHWSDRATRDALTYILTQPFAGRWGMVGTYRYEGPLSPADLGPVVDAVSRGGPVTRVTLEPLTPAQVGDLAAMITGGRLAEPEAERLHRRTGGIPLLVEEVLALRDPGLPDHLRSMFVTRVAEQGSEVSAALQVVAVAEHCDEMQVADALDVDAPRVSDALGRARDADLVVVDARGYRFRHDLLREAVYDEIPPGRRRELHRRVAEQLTVRAVDAAVLAGHWHLAGDSKNASVASMAAAEQAELVHAPAAAHRHYERVLVAWPLLDGPTRRKCGPRDELLRRAAYAAERSGAFARAVELTMDRVAAGRGTPADQALRWERLARYRWEAGDGHGSRAAYEQAVRVLPVEAPAAVRATVLSGLAWHLAQSFHVEEARPLAAEALAACAGVTDPATRWQAHLAQGIAWLGTGTGHEALEESCRLAAAVGIGERVVFSRMWLNLSNQRRGQDTEREADLRTALRAAAAEGLGSSMEAAPRYMLAEYLGEKGRWDEALEELDLNVGRLRVTGVPALFSWGYRSRFAALRGDPAAADEALERTRALTARAPQQPLPLSAALAGRASWLLWEGRVDEAVATAQEAVRLGTLNAYHTAEPLAVLCRAEADRSEQRRRDGVVTAPGVHAGLSDQLAGLRAQPPAPRVQAFVATCEGELCRLRGERTAHPWWAAVQAWQVAGDPYQEACARWRLAWALVADRSGRAQAAAHLAWSHDTAARLGALPLGRAVERFATRARLPLGSSRPLRGEPSLVAALTARELEVLPLLAVGRSNAEIAEILVISPRTVGVHVSRVLNKLGADRRAQVADLARRTGLLDP